MKRWGSAEISYAVLTELLRLPAEHNVTGIEHSSTEGGFIVWIEGPSLPPVPRSMLESRLRLISSVSSGDQKPERIVTTTIEVIEE